MHIYLPVAVFAIVVVVYCEAFSASVDKISTTRRIASLSSMTTTATTRTMISADATLNFQQGRISALISAMTTSDENDDMISTTTSPLVVSEEEEDTKNDIPWRFAKR